MEFPTANGIITFRAGTRPASTPMGRVVLKPKSQVRVANKARQAMAHYNVEGTRVLNLPLELRYHIFSNLVTPTCAPVLSPEYDINYDTFRVA